MRRTISLLLVVLLLSSACAVRKTEKSKNVYELARPAQQKGDDWTATAAWKEVRDLAGKEIEAGRYPTTNYFLRASAYFQLGQWEKGIEDLRHIQPEAISQEEFWIYPLYHVLMGDYYSYQNFHAVAERFYQSVLRRTAWKASSVYLLALERHANNRVCWIEM